MMSGRVFIDLKRLEYVGLERTGCVDKWFGDFNGGGPIESLVHEVEKGCGPSSKLNDGCPKTFSARGLVMGGIKAKAGEWPFMAALQYREPLGGKKFFCGGSLVTSKHVLTGEQINSN